MGYEDYANSKMHHAVSLFCWMKTNALNINIGQAGLISMIMLHLVDILVLQCSSTIDSAVIEAQQRLQECLDIINNLRAIKQDVTLPQLLNEKKDIRNFIHSRNVDIDYYDRFPDPWCALVNDISHFFL